MTRTADAIIVGAGVIGSAIALELGRTGWDVLVVDRLRGPGQGSTSASSAVVRFNYSTFAGVATSWEAKHCWASWADHLGAADGPGLARYHRTGFVFLDVEALPQARSLAFFDRAGVPYEVWDPDALADRLPWMDVGRYWPPKQLDDHQFWTSERGRLGAVFTPDAGFVDDPMLAAANLAAAATNAGVTFTFNRTVAEVLRRGDRVRGVRLADGEELHAPVVVNVAGPWSSSLNRLADVGADFTVTVRPMRQEVHQLTAPAGYSDGDQLGPVIADLDLGTYLRAAPGGGLLVGGTEPSCDELEWLDDPDAANLNPTKPVYDAQATRAARRLPGLCVPDAPRGIAGVYDVADDWTPIYDRTSLDGFYVAMGTSGNQFKNAPVVGRLMATLITSVEAGHAHDEHPLVYTGEHTGLPIDTGTFSRKRPANNDSTHTVMG